MSKHRAPRGGDRRPQPYRHRAEVRPRYGRIAALTSSLLLTAISVLGSAGALPSSADDNRGADDTAVDVAADTGPEPTPTPAGAAADGPRQQATAQVDPHQTDDLTLPRESGTGRRVVFSEGRQRVWLVDDGGTVVSTYPVSGSTLDNLDPGTYQVYSRSRHAVGVESSGTMEYFVRFTRGPSGAAIGFHDIPVKDGAPAQTVDELGSPTSIGCIRQKREDAVRLWEFAPIGTTVVVTA